MVRWGGHALAAILVFIGLFTTVRIGDTSASHIGTVASGLSPVVEQALVQTPVLSVRDTEIPLQYAETFSEPVIQSLLRTGAVVLPLGYDIGERGNVVIAAHSSGDSSFGPYRDAFARIAELTIGEEVEVVHEKEVYRYRVYATDIVWPHNIQALPPAGEPTVTLVTCWPLWTDYQRYLVHARLVQ